ncbi:hypothetical protein HELRODRAFT_156658 [Helobdella robusta]|uniref:FAD dependent oxidoreductase domain-containing protein n=1 Tax=Helobdella robusta TaxID=6412 RepID=T1ELZ5_HELRO|nr:hypothetical protein HELRODRAFT_156658 [Helobdella robusta]ESO08124.1 hypothetical protein HELRODRAFT_156658 [Helobdella robusta]
MKIAILGAGVVGLSTAVQLRQLLPTAELDLIAEKFYDETTSYGAAGIFRPTLSKTPGVEIERIKKWLKDSWKHYEGIFHGDEARLAGVQLISGYQFVNNPQPNPLERDIVFSYRALTDKELSAFPGDRFKYGWFVTTLLIEPRIYLKYLTDKFTQSGGRTIRKTLESFEELCGRYDLVINCMGLGSKELLKDEELVPNRGHLVKVKCDWLKHFVYTGDTGTCYILPGIEVTTIGGTRTDNDLDLTPRKEDTERILNEAYKVLPSLKKAKIVSEWVGLRPHRAPLRIESETMEFPSGKKLQVVHNYGHGAEGISLSWGTSVEAVELAMRLVK